MASVANTFMRLFRGSPAESEQQTKTSPAQHSGVLRRSTGLGEFTRALGKSEDLCILDLGPTSAPNIRHFTGLGYKVYSEDLLLASLDPALQTVGEDDKPALDAKKFLAENLTQQPGTFDAILCWDMADYMEESLVKPVIGRFWSVLKPGGVLLAFFHTKDAGPDAPHYRYHLKGADTLELQRIAAPHAESNNSGRGQNSKTGSSGNDTDTSGFRLQRVFNNRHIENLFRDFASIKFFLARDNVREVLVIR
jgi:SAM-dependent methyltransferase